TTTTARMRCGSARRCRCGSKFCGRPTAPSSCRPPRPDPSTAEAAATLLKGADRAQEIDLAEGRPQHIGEIELAVGALPQQKAGQPDLAAGADDKIGIGQAGGVEIPGDRLR